MRSLIVAAVTAVSINTATISVVHASFIETVCLTLTEKPLLVTIRAVDGAVKLRAGEGDWTEARSNVEVKGEVTHVVTTARNPNGILTARFDSKGGPSTISFSLVNGRNTTYPAVCVSHIRGE